MGENAAVSGRQDLPASTLRSYDGAGHRLTPGRRPLQIAGKDSDGGASRTSDLIGLTEIKEVASIGFSSELPRFSRGGSVGVRPVEGRRVQVGRLEIERRSDDSAHVIALAGEVVVTTGSPTGTDPAVTTFIGCCVE